MIQTLFILTSIVLIISLTWVYIDRDKPTQDADQAGLDNLYKDIEKTANQFSCENAGEQKFTAIGSKARDSASGFIAYSVKIDESKFLKKVEQFNTLQTDYNKKHGVFLIVD
jgi:hypothetical protein